MNEEKQTIVDETISKRPIRKPIEDEAEKNRLISQQEQIEAFLEELKVKIEARETNANYRRVLQDSKDRLVEIAMNAMQIPASDTLRLAEARGNYKERILLTRELLNLKMQEKKQLGILALISSRLLKWATSK